MNCQVSRDGKVFGGLSIAGDAEECGVSGISMVSVMVSGRACAAW